MTIADIRRRFADPKVGTTHSDMGIVLAALDRIAATAREAQGRIIAGVRGPVPSQETQALLESIAEGLNGLDE